LFSVCFLTEKYVFKVINGEKSSFNNTVFGKRRKRTIEAILNNLHTQFDPIKSQKTLFAASSNPSSTQQQQQPQNVPTSKKTREEMRKAEFLRVGQVIE
jgi:hypothetical protein